MAKKYHKQPPYRAIIWTSTQPEVNIKRMTDSIFVLGPRRNCTVIVGIDATLQGTVSLQTQDGIVYTDQESLEIMMALPAFHDRVGTAFTWISSHANAILFDNQPGDRIMAARMLAQAPPERLAIAPEHARQIVPWFLRVWGMPLVLESFSMPHHSQNTMAQEHYITQSEMELLIEQLIKQRLEWEIQAEEKKQQRIAKLEQQP
jgi:hypothetical protein